MTINLAAVVNDIEMEQGASVEVPFAITRSSSPLDLTGFTLNLQVRRTFADTSTIINCTTANGRLVWVNQAGGTFKLVLAPDATTGIRFTADEQTEGSLTGVYDLEIQDTASGFVYKGVKGAWVINREVTRV